MLVGNTRVGYMLSVEYLGFFLILQILGRISLFKVDVHALPITLISRKKAAEEKPNVLLTTGKMEKKKNLQVFLCPEYL